MVLPNTNSHLPAGQNRQRAYVFQINVDEFAYGLTEFFHREEYKFLEVSSNNPIGDVLRLIVA